MVDQRGYIADEKAFSQLVPGVSRKKDVEALLGSPSTRSSFGQEEWHYVRLRMERYAFLRPEVTDQRVVTVRFDANGVLEDVFTRNLADSKEVTLVDQVTPTEGHTLGFFEQVLGNVGRFNKPTDASDR